MYWYSYTVSSLYYQAAALPMSIIIIGVGQADFKDMDILDGDDVRISYNGTQ